MPQWTKLGFGSEKDFVDAFQRAYKKERSGLPITFIEAQIIQMFGDIYVPKIEKYAKQLAPYWDDSDSCDEVASRARAKLFDGQGVLGWNYRGSSFNTWLYKVVLSAAGDLKRQIERQRKCEHPTASLDNPASPMPPDTSCSPDEKAELRQEIRRCLDELPLNYRTILVLREIDGLSASEAARAMGISVELQSTWLNRAKAQMAQCLNAAES